MKPLFLISLCAVFAFMSVTLSHSGGLTKEPSPDKVDPVVGSSRVIEVDEFMTNVNRYQGPVRIRGVVSAVSPNRQMIGLIDKKEFDSCKIVTCAQLTLPVFWTGRMPQVKNTVLIEGEVKEKERRLIFVAQTVKKVEFLQEGSR